MRAGSDLNANLVRFGAGRDVGEHVNDETVVVFVGVAGAGFVEAEGREHALVVHPQVRGRPIAFLSQHK